MRILRVLPFVIAVGVSLVVLFAPGADVPTAPPGVDKVIHGALFLWLAVAGRYSGIAERPLGIALAAYAVGSEILQGALPINRDFALGDIAADLVGVLLGLWLIDRFSAIGRSRRRSNPTSR